MNNQKLKRWSDYAEKMNNQNLIKESQLVRFNEKFGGVIFSEIIEKIQSKYESDKYIDYWYRKGFEPPKSLYFFLLDYAEKYGRKATKKEYKEFGSMFAFSMFVCNGFFFSRIDSQGSAVHIWKFGSKYKEKTKECEHPYAYIYSKGGYEKCNKCGIILCE